LSPRRRGDVRLSGGPGFFLCGLRYDFFRSRSPHPSRTARHRRRLCGRSAVARIHAARTAAGTPARPSRRCPPSPRRILIHHAHAGRSPVQDKTKPGPSLQSRRRIFFFHRLFQPRPRSPPSSSQTVEPSAPTPYVFRRRPSLTSRLVRPFTPRVLLRVAWKGKWNIARLLVACILLWIVAADSEARLARLRLAALPDFDYVAEIAHLRDAGRFGEAVMVADAGIDATHGSLQHAVLDQRQAAEAERDSMARRLKDVGLGALTGTAGLDGDASLERLGGALATDLFVVGDIRDLLIQGAHYVSGAETDPVIIALSTVGIATTVAPEIDWAPAILKIAKKAGALSRRMQEFVIAAVKGRRFKELEALKGDVKILAENASPAGAVRMLRYADDPADAARLAGFVGRNARYARGAFAMHIAGKEGAQFLKQAERLGPQAARAAEHTLVAASKKGPAGVRLLTSPLGKALIRPHPILGFLKGAWKGNAEEFLRASLDRIGPKAWWILPLLAAWAFIEAALLARRWSTIASPRPA